jgi:hypothetical protein
MGGELDGEKEDKKEIHWRIDQAGETGDEAGRRIGEHIRAVTGGDEKGT